MKTSAVFVATAVVAMLSLDSTTALRAYLKKFPNGEAAFTQALAHVGDTEASNAFGKLFTAQGKDYTAALCKSTFPGTSMTVGEAFGDPCCTWKAGGKADFAVSPFTVPTDKKVCAASAPAASSAAPAASSAAPAAAPSPAPGAATPVPSASAQSHLMPGMTVPMPGTMPGMSVPAPGAATPAPAGQTPKQAIMPAAGVPVPASQAGVPVPAPAPAPAAAGPGKVLPAAIPATTPASANGTQPLVPGPAPAPTPAGSGKAPAGKATGPTKICT